MLERPAPTPGVVVEELDDDVCLYRPDVDEVLVLNETAADIWRLCDGELAVTQIVGLLASAYGTSPEELTDDVHSTLDRLQSGGYLLDASQG